MSKSASAKLMRFAAALDLDPKHQRALAQTAIARNMAVGNYGCAHAADVSEMYLHRQVHRVFVLRLLFCHAGTLQLSLKAWWRSQWGMSLTRSYSSCSNCSKTVISMGAQMLTSRQMRTPPRSLRLLEHQRRQQKCLNLLMPC